MPPSQGRRSFVGQALVDYLILTAAVAGVLVPIVYKYFGEPIRESLFSQRGKFVEMVAQTPVRPGKNVPNEWFGQKSQAKFPDNQIEDPGAIQEKQIQEPTDLKDTGKIQEKRIASQKTIQTRPIKDPARIESRPIGSGGGGGGGAGPGGGGSGVGSDGFDGDFLNGGGKDSAGAGSGSGEEGGGGGAAGGRRRGGGEFGESGGGGSGRGDKAEGTAKKGKGSGGGEGGSSAVVAGKGRQSVAVDQAAERERTKSGRWDFWALLRILILGVILFLVILITLGNMKKR